jgi:probable phosphoglycerate mutase
MLEEMSARTAIVYLARHGETDWNAARRWQGHRDVPLNANGHAQAERLAERVRGLGVAGIASSDLSRARATAEIVARALGLTLGHIDTDLRERAFGCFEGLTREECTARYPDAWASYATDPRRFPPGGEDHDALIARMRRGVLRAAADLPSPVLAIGHGGAIRALIGALRGARTGPVANGAGYRLAIEGEQFVAIEPFDS